MAKAGFLARLFSRIAPATDDVRAPPAPEILEDPASQYAALVWRRRKGQVEVLMVTSRETRRWIIPKGWPMKTRLPHEAAAREAFEEAGVEGKPLETSLGAYHYDKLLKSGETRHCAVDVFPMKVVKTLEKWPEKGQRDRKWFPAEEAAGLVAEPELTEIIRAFGAANSKPPAEASAKHKTAKKPAPKKPAAEKPAPKKPSGKTQTATPKGGRAVRQKAKAPKPAA